MNVFLLLALVTGFLCNIRTAGTQTAANFVIEKFYLCEEVPHQQINITLIPKTFVAKAQVLDIHMSTPIPLDNQLRFGGAVHLETGFGKLRRWQQLFSVEDDFCRTIQMYLGELAYGIETAMAIPKGSCPIARGNYHAINYTIDFERLKLQTFPLGRVGATLKFLKKPEKTVILCAVFIMNNA